MNKKIVISFIALVILSVAYFLLSPLWTKKVLNEDIPVSTSTQTVKDDLMVMDSKTKADFEKQTMEMKDEVMAKNDSMPENKPTIISQSNMIAKAHDVKGSALIVKSGEQTFLRFENLKTINGPDLRIYLSSDLSNDDIIDLGPIRATEGNANYLIPAGTDLSKYRNAMIWCRTFRVLFSYAQF